MYNKNAIISITKFPRPISNVFIYALIDPDSNIVRYVGKTAAGFSRIRSHIKDKRENTRKVNWVKSLVKKNKIFKVNYLQYCNTNEELNLAEKYWIKFYRDLGHDLCNHTDGGECTYIHKYTSEQKNIISIKTKLAMARPEVREKLRLSHLGKPSPKKGLSVSEEIRKKNYESNNNLLGKKVIDQHGKIYRSFSECCRELNCSINTVKDRVFKNNNKPLHGLYLRLYTGE